MRCDEDAITLAAADRLSSGRYAYRFLKRSFDIVFSLLVLACLSWLYLEPVNMYRGYAFAISADAAGLAKAVSGLTLPVELVGTEARSRAPLSDEVAAWYERASDERRVIRSSTAVIVDGVLHVTDGPLVGQENRIIKVDRPSYLCVVLG